MLPNLEAPQFPSGNGSAEVAKQSYRIVDLNRDDPESITLLIPLIDRCVAFSEKYRSDTLPDILRSLMFQAFHTKSERWKMIAFVDESGKIIGHIVADIEAYGLLGDVVFVIQVEKDHGLPEPVQAAIRTDGIGAIREWAAKYRIKHILNMALSEAHARLYQKEFGFKPYRFLLKIDTE